MTTSQQRLASLDAFRGITIAGMLLVNNPGSWAAIHPPLAHAPWHGWTPTDLIFPFFLFIVGITTHLSLGARRARGDDDRALARQVLRRGALIFLFGLFLSWFPGFTWTDVPGNPDPSFLDRAVHRLEHLRILGVLQRIGLAYTIAGLISLRTTLVQQVAVCAGLLLAYWFAMTLLPVPGTGLLGMNTLHDPAGTLQAWVDRAILGTDHIWAGSRSYDPEGILSTIPAVASVMLGGFAGRWIATPRPLDERLAGLLAAGVVGAVAGTLWGYSFPINKNLWTSSYALFTAGLAALALGTCIWLIDRHGVGRWAKPFIIFGTNPIVAFVGSGLMARLIYSIIKVERDGTTVALQKAIHDTLFASWLPPKDASLAFAIAFDLVWLAILTVLYRRRIFLKV